MFLQNDYFEQRADIKKSMRKSVKHVMGRVNDDYYAVIDTNVLVSALLSSHDAATVQVANRSYDGDFIPLLNDDILKEYNKVLRRKKFHFSEEAVCTLINAIMDCGEYIIPPPTGKSLPDRKDLPFYEVVMEKQDNHVHLVA